MTLLMKPSGIEWIGEIPEGWITLRGKNVLNLLKRPFNEEDGVVTCFRDGEVTLRSKRREEGFTFADKEIGYQGIKKGDLVIHGMDGFAGAIGISDSDGKGSPVLNICREKIDKDLKFVMYYLRMLSTQNVFIALATGIRERYCDLRWNKIADLLFPNPPLPEQQAIADYLDRKSELFDSTIEKQKTVIKKLKLYKQSVITEVVTKGLDPTIKMKPSGIEWIGDIPEGWETKKGKYIFEIYGSNVSETFEKDYLEIPYFKVDSLNMVKDNFYISEAPESLKVNNFTTSIKAPIILIPKRGAAIYTNKVRIVMIDCLFDSNIMALRPINNDIKFLSYVIFGRKLTDIGDVSTIPQINNKHIRTLDIPLPPLPEQQVIADYLDQKCSQIDSIIEQKQNLIEKLSTYKKSLIYECVTGKREVTPNA